jgi:hypothetical protein
MTSGSYRYRRVPCGSFANPFANFLHHPMPVTPPPDQFDTAPSALTCWPMRRLPFYQRDLPRSVSMRRLILSAALSVFAMGLALADVRIQSSAGGVAKSYLNFFLQLRKSGERVVIDGPCLSACTLVLSAIPRNRICVTSRAILGFHAPLVHDPRSGRTFRSRDATRVVTAAYPPSVRAWIRRKGGLKQNFIYLRGHELEALYPRC